MIAFLRGLFISKERKALDVHEFAQRHKNYLVIVCDPKDDTIHASYRGRIASGLMRSADGINHHVLKNMMRHSTFDRQIDRFIGGLIDITKVPLDIGGQFYAAIDGMFFNISKKIQQDKKS